MTRYSKTPSGQYRIAGKTFEILIGSRAQVHHGTAYKTTGGLTSAHLMQNKSGRVVSRKKHGTAKRENRLLKHGYGTKKGTFGFVRVTPKGSRKSRKSRKGSKKGSRKR
jgi:hypothetical protein